MNIQHERIEQACANLKLETIAIEWQAIADFLEALLHVEMDAKTTRTQATLLKFAGFPAVKHFEDYDFNFATGAPKKAITESYESRVH